MFGSIIGSILLFFAVHERKNHFTDYTYWVFDDGIRFFPEESEAIERTR